MFFVLVQRYKESICIGKNNTYTHLDLVASPAVCYKYINTYSGVQKKKPQYIHIFKITRKNVLTLLNISK